MDSFRPMKQLVTPAWGRVTSPEILMSREVLISLLVVLGTALLYQLWKAAYGLWFQPRRIRKIFEAQGIKCLPRPFPHGNLGEFVALGMQARSKPMPQLAHDIVPRIFPHLVHWSKQHGKLFVYWFGSEARLILTEPEQAREILNNKFGHYMKPEGRPDTRDLAGKGLASVEGEKWAQHRRIMNPAFFIEKLKAMIPTMASCAATMLESWGHQVEKGAAVDAFDEFRRVTADIIAHTAFGSSYAEGKQVFEMQHEQQKLITKITRNIYIPGSRFIPTATNRYRWQLNKNIVKILTKLIEKRMASCNMGDDLLGIMMTANKGQLQGTQKKLAMGIEEIIDECKTFFFAGHETTSSLLTWTILLLASSPEWQERARQEVHEVCGMQELPTADAINQLKMVGMVLNEALRLYPPGVAVFRKATTDMQLGKLQIPAETVLIAPIIVWHHDSRFWGPDATEFRPDRFMHGTPSASAGGAYMPFSMGPRNCIGQTFATLEAKVVLSCILQRYRFRLSTEYKHAPTIVLTLQPQFGMPIVLERL